MRGCYGFVEHKRMNTKLDVSKVESIAEGESKENKRIGRVSAMRELVFRGSV